MAKRKIWPQRNPTVRPQHRSRVASALRATSMVLAAMAVVVLILISLGWWAGHHSASLAWVIGHAQRWLPADTQLSVSDSKASVLEGGTIGRLQWKSPDITIDVSDLHIRWDWTALWDKHVLLEQLQAQTVDIHKPASTDDTPPRPLTDVTLPVHVTAPLRIGTVTLSINNSNKTGSKASTEQSTTPIQIRNIDARYRFDGSEHRIQLVQLEFAQGQYSGDATALTTAPFALQAHARAKVSATVPGTAQPAQLTATAQLQGWLGDAHMPWEISAQLQSSAISPATPEDQTIPRVPAKVLQTDIHALALPWSAQPWIQADAKLEGLNAANWWPNAPTTALSGNIHIAPVNAPQALSAEQQSTTQPQTPPRIESAAPSEPIAITVEADLRNAVPGPWDTAHLPIAQAKAQGRLDGLQWTINSASIFIATPSSAAGKVQLQGIYDGGTGHVETTIRLQDVLPTALHTALRASTLSGSIQASTLPPAPSVAVLPAQPTPESNAGFNRSVRFEVDVHTAHRQTNLAANPLQIETIKAQGQWQPTRNQGTLDVHDIQVNTLQTRLASKRLQWSGLLGEPSLWDAKGDLQSTAPGMGVQLDGQISQSTGQGKLTVRIEQPEVVQQWLLRVQQQIALVMQDQTEWLPPALTGTFVRGSANLQVQWRGGWNSLLQAVNTPNASTSPVSIQAALDIPQWRMGSLSLPPNENTSQDSTAKAPSNTIVPPLALRGIKLTLNGTPRKILSSIDGEVTAYTAAATNWDARTASQIQLRSGFTAEQTQPGLWQGQLDASDMQLKLPIAGQQPAWLIKLPQATSMTAQWSTPTQHGATKLIRAEIGSGQLEATLVGQTPKRSVNLEWEPVRWQGNARWQTQGRMQGLPLVWLDALGLPAPENNSTTSNTKNNNSATQASRLAQWGIGGDVVLDGQWNMAMADTLNAHASIWRSSGDLRLYYGAIAQLPDSIKAAYNGSPAGIKEAKASIRLQGDTLEAQLQWRSARAGDVTAQLKTTTRIQRNLAALSTSPPQRSTNQPPKPSASNSIAAGAPWWDTNAPLSGTIDAQLPDIGIWSALAPPGWRVRGTMAAQLQLSGTLATPQWDGRISADDLAMRSVADGLDLQGGKLRATLQATTLTINSLELHGGQGSSLRILGPSGNRTAPARDGGILRGSGTVQWDTQATANTSGIRMQLSAQAEQLKILVRADRQASVSGDLQLGLEQGQFKLRGNLTVDRASILLPDETAPTLGDDVVVRSSRPHPLATSTTSTSDTPRTQPQPTQLPDIDIQLGLGEDFALEGHGITTRLAGQLHIQSSPERTAPSVTGDIKTVQGRYRAWGQLLEVETGLARFSGAYDNPSLDILALRAQTSERVGVQISGTAQRPRVRLYSDPIRPDAEVLSLLVLGRTTASAGLQAGLLQQAAMALLGGKTNGSSTKIASRLGLDEIGLVGLGSGDDANSAALSVGKRLTKDLYVTYEQSLTSALGTLYIFYELSRQLTLRGQTGSRDAVDIVYTMRYD